MNQPRVSILLPYRNAVDTLDECMASIAAQSFSHYEVLAVDDGSTDGSADLIRERAFADERIRPLRNVGRGIVAALETGLRAARGALVARMDGDDLMREERLALQAGYLDGHPQIDLVASKVHVFPAPQVGVGTAAYIDWQDRCLTPDDIANEIYVEAPFVHPSVMFRAERVAQLGGYRQGDFPEDYDLWLRLNAAGCRMAKLDRELLAWRQSPDSLSRVDSRYARTAFDALRAHYLAVDDRLHRGRPLAIWGAGRRTRMRVRHLEERGLKPDVYIDIDPDKVGNRIAGTPVEAPQWLEPARKDRMPPLVLGYVASHGAREQIAVALEGMGYRRGQDYLMVG